MADASPESATSAASSSAPRPTASRSISTAGRPPGSPSRSCRTPTRSRSPTRSRRKWTSSPRAFRTGLAYVDALRHDEIRQGRDQRGLSDAVRGRRSGADRHSRLPAGLAGDAGPGDDGSGDDHRRLRRDGGARFFDQSRDAVRHRAGDRHRRRRRHRHRRGRLALCRARHARPRGGGQGDGRADRSGHRHHAGADVGVHPRRLPAGTDRTALPAIRAGHRRHRLHQRHQRRDLEADAKRAVAAAADAARKAQLLLPRLQRRLRARRARLCETDRRDDAPQRRDGGPRADSGRRRHLGADARADRVSCRTRTRAI